MSETIGLYVKSNLRHGFQKYRNMKVLRDKHGSSEVCLITLCLTTSHSQRLFKEKILGTDRCEWLWSIATCKNGTCWYSKVTISCIAYPCDPKRFLYFLADVSHLLTILKQSLLSNKFFIISKEFVIKYTIQ